ncbi:hypothetical protein K469DRAFT_683962 [Zopfia rhizophila CBS 207.26]|uniref:Ecp2 effector protein domain-containing protein n=1 Tax=Zopfia rhizophila CBS 207.26 TaxID=1314779 RepID=A0A6A6D7Q0_9PEZI|nr:hypothetical protein K469DRAFT_683962 [Zopfia rhizophila CBS 207.26]
MKCNQAIFFAAILIDITLVSAKPLEIQERDIDPQHSPFIKCIQQKHPKFPGEGKPTSQEVRKCVGETRPKAKRDEEVPGPEGRPVEGELVYEPEVGSSVEPRGIVDKVFRVGKDLYLDKKPWCDGDKTHDNFVWVSDIRAKSNDICKQLREQIDTSEIGQDGGVGLVIDHLTNGYDKQGHQLKDKRKVTATYILSFIPPAKMAINEIKEIASGVYDLCNDGIERIATKGQGCSEEIPYYRPSHAKHYTGTGAIGGYLQMFWGDKANSVADLTVDFSNDG